MFSGALLGQMARQNVVQNQWRSRSYKRWRKNCCRVIGQTPRAKAFVSLAESQENACGDGVTSCILLASELMSEARGYWRGAYILSFL